jgi:hypothetical protein
MGRRQGRLVRDPTGITLYRHICRHDAGSATPVFCHRYLQRATKKGRRAIPSTGLPRGERQWTLRMFLEASRPSKVEKGACHADLRQYAEDERFTCADSAAAEAVFRKHHVFLLMCFLNRAQGIGWSNTPLYQFFRRQYPVRIIQFTPMASLTFGRGVLTHAKPE